MPCALQGHHHFTDKKLLAQLLGKLDHPDLDVKERVFLVLINLARWPHIQVALLDAGGLESVQLTRDSCNDTLRNADSDDRDMLLQLQVLASDLEDQLRENYFSKSEL